MSDQNPAPTSPAEVAGTSTDDAFVQELEALVQSDRAAILMDAVARHLEAGVHPSTYDELEHIGQATGLVRGWPLLAWACQEFDDPRAVIADRWTLTERAESFVIRFITLFGTQVHQSFVTSHDSPVANDWFRVGREVRQNLTTGEYETTLYITKYNGERVTITADPDSLARLARQIVRAVPANGDRDSIAPSIVEDLIAALDEVRGWLAADPGGDDGDDSDDEAIEPPNTGPNP